MDVWSHDRLMRAIRKIKKVGEQEGATKGYRRQFGKLWEISVFPLTLLIMDVPGIIREDTSVNAVMLRILKEPLGIEKKKRTVVYDDFDHLARGVLRTPRS